MYTYLQNQSEGVPLTYELFSPCLRWDLGTGPARFVAMPRDVVGGPGHGPGPHPWAQDRSMGLAVLGPKVKAFFVCCSNCFLAFQCFSFVFLTGFPGFYPSAS